MNRPGCVAAPLVDVPVVVGLQDREPGVEVRRAGEQLPAEFGNDGKHIEPSTPFTSMSRTRSAMSKQPDRISSNEVGSMPYSSGGRPATALSPMFGISLPS